MTTTMRGICEGCGEPARPWSGRGRMPLTCEACRVADLQQARADYQMKRKAWLDDAKVLAANPHAARMRAWRERRMKAAGRVRCPDCGDRMYRLNLALAPRVRCDACKGRRLAASIGRGPLARRAA